MPAAGWITAMAVSARGGNGSVTAYLGLWSGDGNRIGQSAAQTWNTTLQMRSASIQAARVPSTAKVYVGFWSGSLAQYGYASAGPEEEVYYQNSQASLPTNCVTGRLSDGFVEMGSYFDYVANAAPLQGQPSSPAAGAVLGQTPTFSGSLPHPSSEGGLDYSTSVHLTVWPKGNPANPVYNQVFATTQTERNNGAFSRSPVTLTPGQEYEWKYSHIDSFGVRAPDSTTRSFAVSEGPSPPGELTPADKVNTLTPAVSGFYTHPTGVASGTIRAKIFAENGTTLVLDSGDKAVAAANGAAFSVPFATLFGSTAALSWATRYVLEASFKDANAVQGGTQKKAFRTNFPPTPPTNLSPTSGKRTASRRFSADLSDPDGDAVTLAQIEILNATTGAIIPDAGGNGWRQMAVASGRATYDAPASETPINASYKYRIRASDGSSPGYGTPTEYVQFTLAEVPIISLISPYAGRKNRIPQPSAEYDTSGLPVYWTETARTATDHVDRVSDGDAESGVAAWVGTASASGDNRLLSNPHDVDPARGIIALAAFKRIGGSSATHFAVRCYDASDVLLGTVYPQSVAAAQGANVPGAFTRYGGVVWPVGSVGSPSMPAGTARVRFEATPSRGSAAVVRMDAFFFDQLPAGIAPGDWQSVSAWHGYADGDEGGYGIGGYSWSGNPGGSESLVLPVLTAPGAAVAISYSHNTGLAKAADRVVVEKWANGKFSQTADSLWVSSSRKVVPTPAGAFTNEGRYRITVHARDTVGGEGQADAIEVDVRYVGPAEPVAYLNVEDGERAEIGLMLEPSATPEGSYAGTEVEVSALDGSEGPFVHALILDRNRTRVVYPFPVSNKPYLFRVRDVAFLGAERVQSKWTEAVLSCDHGPHNFVKDALDPSVFVRFQHTSGAFTEPELDTPGASHLTWGSEAKVRFVGSARLAEGKTGFVLWPDEAYSVEERYETMLDLLKRRPTICLLTRLPRPAKVFASVADKAPLGVGPASYPRFEFGWEKTGFPEDYYERVGEA